MPEIKQTDRCAKLLQRVHDYCDNHLYEFITPEHLLFLLLDDQPFYEALTKFVDYRTFHNEVRDKLNEMEKMPAQLYFFSLTSVQMDALLNNACNLMVMSSADELDIPHLVRAMLDLPECWASYLLKSKLGEHEADFMSALITAYTWDEIEENDDEEHEMRAAWRKLVTCMNDAVEHRNPLIGRQQELQRTIQVLCRKDKNNPLHVGEPGVGKTALVWGLASLINQGNVPPRLQGSRIYMLDLGTLLAGTQFRGEFEERIKQIMDGVATEAPNNIIYIDEIHNIVGAGAVNGSSMDASNMLKPYLESGDLRFIGSTTYEEYNKYLSRSKGMVRRFQQIDIMEPGIDETINIIRQLRPHYEAFHHCVYEDAAIETAVTASAKYVNDRFLPDKAIDLIDEAGAKLETLTRDDGQPPVVTKALITEVLAKTCKVEALAIKDNEEDENARLLGLRERLLSKIYGQDEAIKQVVEAVLMAKAGLAEDDKPLASLLFVGPTGVGKTEVVRQLAQELGIELLRFDMSEYTEKHTVAKLIGSPAGYVGYEDGGLLTDAIRRAPNSVLLLDEIEKAHEDIYNILLQVMDYARLTDNKGRKADFRNVIVVMTSNAGAQYASQASVGFGKGVERGEAMLRQVKKTFKPEFINRLSATVIFHDMDREMATRILRKKLGELQAKLTARNVQLTLTDEVFEQLLNEGFSHEYGAREMDRVIARRLKPILTREMLFGKLKKGGPITVSQLEGIF